MKDNLIALKTHAFARQMVKAYQYIREKKEFNMSDFTAENVYEQAINILNEQ